MCMIACAPAGVSIPRKYLRNGFRENPHMCGFVASKDGKLFLRRGFKSFKSFWKVYRNYQDCPKIVHFRWANVGKINIENSHPFFVTPDLAFAHNGTIPIKTGDGKSDTRTFNEQVLRSLHDDNSEFLSNPSITWMMSKSIGQSKLSFIDKDGTITIINEHLGVTHEGIWFSNNDYKAFPNTVFAGRHTKATTTTNFYRGGRHNQGHLVEYWD